MTIPPTMRAIDPAGPGGPEVLTLVERPVPTPGAGEVLLRVVAAGVNRPDLLQREGRYPMPPGAPTIPGLEAAGEVVALGEGTERWRVGDKVTALLLGGGYAQYATAPAVQCLPIPAGCTMIEAAGLPEACFTVWSNLIDRAAARAGETALVHGGTSGVGIAAIQIGRAMGLHVLVTAGSAAKCDAARALGAAHAFDYTASDFIEQTLAATAGRGVDIVLDMIGGDYLPRNMKCLAPGGRHVSIAAQHGREAALDIGLMMARGLKLTGSLLRPQPVAFKAAIARALEREYWPLIASGGARPVIDRVYPLAQAAEAHRRMQASQHIGKIILEV